MPKTETAPAWTWSPEVLTFAVEHGIESHLEPVRELTERLFPNRLFKVFVVEDPSIAGEFYLTFDIDLGGMTWNELYELERKWLDEMYQLCPFPLSGFFYLGMTERYG